ncbi:hypothetical protein [Tenacibaculum discolor]|uniref:hypothetical protein n=1 Tax=Tenacibaculum discolor TaxID=361581 RepID=UPI000F5931A7|nr:hypothetical protein [Tenacibaculum discolor]
MEWNKVIEWIIPVITAVIGGLIAIFQMRQNIKLTARLKWKEEFRVRLNDFINSAKKLHHSSIIARLRENELSETKFFLDKVSDFDAAFYALDLLLFENDERVKDLIMYRDKIRENSTKESTDDKDYLLYFYYLAKDLYNDKSFVSNSLK